MRTITFECEVITPMFLAGADGVTPELRPASIKGALRFWWRAMNGHLSLEQLKKSEGEIFGGTEDGMGRSKIIIRIDEHEKTEDGLKVNNDALLVPHKPFMKAKAFAPKQEFKIILGLTKEVNGMTIEKLADLFWLTCTLGGFGKRTRRGMGSVTIKSYKIGEQEVKYPKINNKTIVDALQNVTKKELFSEQNNMIISDFKKYNAYPYIKSIEVGRTTSQILDKISNTTHQIHQKSNYSAYEASLGYASRGRMASPIYVSTIQTEEGLKPIITILNTVTERERQNMVNSQLQTEFKNNIL
jgi:CRISPR-associated protein Cmr1